MANYSQDARIAASSAILEKLIEVGQKKVNKNFQSEEQDILEILLANARKDVENLTRGVKQYSSNHKTDTFHDIQDFKTKLLFNLDSIDVSDNPKARQQRYDLYTKVSQLANELEGKIHENHSECKDCVQVKVVMLNI